ncbi:hypothetical protein GGU10DRAFT_420697 [Lentinula aff. detonsa]|uniref:Uncharacterized protein n=1 Tax=Lentinula aff. detonsa TaxID=2804958 RepID=A0AA38NM66_9AGAR|nr:hypothetical protein GGU10DRAFT_420697 [Lentinula aff. detonsa]
MQHPESSEYLEELPKIQDIIFKKNSKSSHLKSRQHVKALGSLPNVPVSILHTAPSFASLPSSHFLDKLLESSDEEETDNPPDPLDDIVMDDDGVFLDREGEPLVFSAGESHSAKLARQDAVVYQSLYNLDFLETHSLLGEFDDSGTAERLDDFIEDSSDSIVGQISAAIEALATISDNDSGEIDEDEKMHDSFETTNSSDWFPHPSKTSFMLDMLDNLPRLRLSDDHLKAIIWVMRECGTPNVPFFSELRRTQKRLASELNLCPEHHVSSLGNHFFMTHPSKLFAMDWANPLVWKHLHVYPEISTIVSETYQASKWTEEVSLDELSPMWADWSSPNQHRHFYVNELALTSNSNYVVVLRWVTVDGIVYADVLHTQAEERTNSIHIDIISDQQSRIPAHLLIRNLPDLQAIYLDGIIFSNHSPVQYTSVNPLRVKAKGSPMFRLRVIPWSDDVSGNVSKQYNAHTNIYVTNANLPHQKLSQEYFIRYCSTSSVASSSEQFVALCQDFHEDHWTEAYDCELKQDILFQIIPHFLPADNPQQSETASHIGVNGNRNCRRDKIGGSEAEKESNEVYESLYHPGTPRTVTETVQIIQSQVRLACRGNPQDAVAHSCTLTGVKDKISQFWIEQILAKFKIHSERRLKNPQTHDPKLNDKNVKNEVRKAVVMQIMDEIEAELWGWVVTQPKASYDKLVESDPARSCLRPGDHFNPLLRTRGVDPHKDTPGEMLHTWLLGNDKYIWYFTNTARGPENEANFAVRLQCSFLDGLTIAPPRAEYIIKYKNSLIGKHFKTIQQLAIFHIRTMCSPEIFELWKATGELGAFLWVPEIRDMDAYLHDLQILIDNLLDCWAATDPRRIITKIKIHVLVHLPDDIRRFGPSVIFATEIFECFNAVFRMCSILSNHLAPSRDIALTLADKERFKHMVSGGWWKDLASDSFVQAGPSIHDYLKRDSQLQRRLGWADDTSVKAGLVKLSPIPHMGTTRGKRQAYPWAVCTQGIIIHNELDLANNIQTSDWNECSLVTSCSKDLCRVGTWVFFSHEMDRLIGRIIRILSRSGIEKPSEDSYILIQHFQVLNENDPVINMPILIDVKSVFSVRPKDILFNFNTQHDCINGKCKIIQSTSYVLQERIETEKFKKVVEHSDDTRFFLNMHGLHNAHLIREALPRHLVAPTHLIDDRVAFHKQLAAGLQITGVEKRALKKAKAAATRAKNKQAKEAPSNIQKN